MEAQILHMPQTQSRPRISVIMVSFMTGPALHESVAAVLDDPDIYELILVDNGSTEAGRQARRQSL